ncbi:glycosyltransferase family 2 protein [Bacillus norwichensis]|uniref:Glycosyltransferase n=1 Tax=Bacillus norwichensis TaxID=2762217 RepID=A0ABR8VQV3_9BACI|nr:glycosyltransferase family 2 protein [Bacillus norwichensis]MBD8006801.1 glycosyltransferase [Bacillus norwichensis]
MKTISLCMIVKNEEAYIEKCLLSVRNIVHEMIIVDTGSTDRTKEICERLGATIYQYEWDNNFSEARNFGLQLCQSDWIIWLDADEELDDTNKEKIHELLQNTAAKVISLPVFNYFGSMEKLKKEDFHLLYQPRLFLNHIDIIFSNQIHESIVYPNDLLENDLLTLNVPIHHYGYTDEAILKKQKSQRNLNILKEELSNPDHSPWIKYYIASELSSLQNYELAFQFLNQSILEFIYKKVHPPAILYKLKYQILITTENWVGAKESIDKALLLYPDYVDLHYYKGCILYNIGYYKEALSVFNKCLELGNDHSDYLILNGAGSFRAQNYIKLCAEQMAKLNNQ